MTGTTGRTADLVRRLHAGDAAALGDLVAHACDRLRSLTRRMLRGYPAVRRWDQTDDVLQGALLRLARALDAARPESARHFYHLAALQVRRELLDLAARYRGPLGLGTNHQSDPSGRLVGRRTDESGEPADLLGWGDFHRAVERLPDDERAVFELVWYDGLTQDEAAAVLGVSDRTVKRRWQRGRVAVQRALDGLPPV